MCRMFSGFTTENELLYFAPEASDSHEFIADLLGVTREPSRRVQWEFYPEGGAWGDVDKYVLHTDQDIIPEWWTAERQEEVAEALRRRITRMIRRDTVKALAGGPWILTDGFSAERTGDCVIVATCGKVNLGNVVGSVAIRNISGALTTGYLYNATLTTGDISNGATLTTGYLDNATLTTGYLDNATLTTGHLYNGATLTTGYLDNATLTTGHLYNGATLTTGDISNGATLTTGHLSNGATLTTGHLYNGATLTTGHLYNGATLTTGYLDNATLTTGYLYNATLTTGHLYNGATLTTGYLYNATLTTGDISNGATLGFGTIYENATLCAAVKTWIEKHPALA